MGVHIRQIMRTCDTTEMFQAKSSRAINHPNQYETNHSIYFIDQLVKFDYGTAATNVVTTFVNMNGQVLKISRKVQFYKYVKCTMANQGLYDMYPGICI